MNMFECSSSWWLILRLGHGASTMLDSQRLLPTAGSFEPFTRKCSDLELQLKKEDQKNQLWNNIKADRSIGGLIRRFSCCCPTSIGFNWYHWFFTGTWYHGTMCREWFQHHDELEGTGLIPLANNHQSGLFHLVRQTIMITFTASCKDLPQGMSTLPRMTPNGPN